MGALVAKQAADDDSLKDYRNKFHTYSSFLKQIRIVNTQILYFAKIFYLSLSGPHLGLKYHPSFTHNVALWLIQKLKKSDSLQQLQLKDNTTLKPPSLPYLYKLLRKPAFAYFKYCVLVSTAGDKYVPFHSSRIELSREADNDKSDFGKIHKDSIRQVERMILQ